MKMRKPQNPGSWFDRNQKPDPGFYPRERHLHILDLVWEFGLLTDYQLKAILGIKKSRLHELMKPLWNNHYLNRPNPKVRAGYDYMFWLLARKGARVVAQRQNIEYAELDWVRSPSRTQTHHDVSVNDLRLIIQIAANNTAGQREEVEFVDWVSETTFRSWQDQVQYTNLAGKPAKRRFVADGYIRLHCKRPGKKPWYTRLLLEVEIAPKANPRFADQKILAGLAYVQSEIYPKRFGVRGARFLFVLPNKEKMDNYRRAAQRVVSQNDARYFYFALFDEVNTETVFYKPIWWRPGDKQPVALLKGDE